MEIPIYTQEAADLMLALPKRAAYEAQIYAITGQHRAGFASREFSVSTEGPSELRITYKVIQQANFETGSFSVTLMGSAGDKPPVGLCRYDVHDSLHANENCPCCGPPPEILPGVFHVHRYNACAVRTGWTWCKCAVPIELDPRPSTAAEFRELVGRFVSEMKLKFSDADTARLFYGEPR